jgi:hypothetical protein
MLPSQLFWQEIKDELVPLPYCPASPRTCTARTSIWCARRGHKMPEAQHRFTPAFMSMNGVRRGEPRVPDPEKLAGAPDGGRPAAQASRVLHGRAAQLDEAGPGIGDLRHRARMGGGGINEFRMALRAFEAEGGQSSQGAPQGRQEAAF